MKLAKAVGVPSFGEALRTLVDHYKEMSESQGFDLISLGLQMRHDLDDADFYVVKEVLMRALCRATGVDEERLLGALEKVDGIAREVFSR